MKEGEEVVLSPVWFLMFPVFLDLVVASFISDSDARKT